MEKAPKWYTIKEASKYLGIGEPTLYRWMRDKKITYRKIGDSTRFTKQDLDAFVRIVPSEKDVSQVQEICPICHSEGLTDGLFRSTGLNYFYPSNTKFWTIKDHTIKTHAKMCQLCGAITLFGDVEKLKFIQNEEENK